MADDKKKKQSDLKQLLLFFGIIFFLWFVTVYVPGRTTVKSLNDKFIEQPQSPGQLETYNKPVEIFNRIY